MGSGFVQTSKMMWWTIVFMAIWNSWSVAQNADDLSYAIKCLTEEIDIYLEEMEELTIKMLYGIQGEPGPIGPTGATGPTSSARSTESETPMKRGVCLDQLFLHNQELTEEEVKVLEQQYFELERKIFDGYRRNQVLPIVILMTHDTINGQEGSIGSTGATGVSGVVEERNHEAPKTIDLFRKKLGLAGLIEATEGLKKNRDLSGLTEANDDLKKKSGLARLIETTGAIREKIDLAGLLQATGPFKKKRHLTGSLECEFLVMGLRLFATAVAEVGDDFDYIKTYVRDHKTFIQGRPGVTGATGATGPLGTE